MEISRLIISFLVATIIGWNILFWFIKRDMSFSLLEKCALSFIIGLAALTLQMFFYSLLKIKFSILPLLLPHIFISIVNIFLFVNTTPTGNELPKTKSEPFDILLMSGIIFQFFHAFFKALIKPMDSYDSVGNFAFKAKLFFMERYIPYELFLRKSADIQHGDYPLFIPLSETWVYMFLGRWNDLLVNALFPMFFLSLLVIFYFALKRIIGKRLSLVSSFFLATIPHFLNYATNGYADLPLAMFYSASFIYIFLWISYKRESKYLYLGAALSFFAVWTKNEGALLSLINILILLIFTFFARKDLTKVEARKIAYFLLIVIGLSAIWLNFIHHTIGLENELVRKETFKLSVAIKHLDRIPLILYDCQKHILGPKKWNISLLVFFVGLLFYFKTAFKGHFKYITLSILLAYSGYAAAYLITPLEIHYHLQTTGSRLLLHFLPLVVFWIGYLAKEILNAESNIHR
jgi:hypothetical protein